VQNKIKVAILDDHQSIIDGYLLRLREHKEIAIIDTALNSEDLIRILKTHPDIDVLITDLQVPISSSNEDYTLMRTYIPKMLNERPGMNVLVISMFKEMLLIKELYKAGISGYILKEDTSSIQKLAVIIKKIANGSQHFSEKVKAILEEKSSHNNRLTRRQTEILTICANYPDMSAKQIALNLGVSHSTVRNLLSESYERLEVHTKTAALARAKQLGLVF